MALSVACALSANPRPLAGMLPYGDRTFLSTTRQAGPSSGCPTAQANLSIALAGRPTAFAQLYIYVGNHGDAANIALIKRINARQKRYPFLAVRMAS